jgi:hypothetical protein
MSGSRPVRHLFGDLSSSRSPSPSDTAASAKGPVLSRRSLLLGSAAVLCLPPLAAHLVRRDGWVLRAEDI